MFSEKNVQDIGDVFWRRVDSLKQEKHKTIDLPGNTMLGKIQKERKGSKAKCSDQAYDVLFYFFNFHICSITPLCG